MVARQGVPDLLRLRAESHPMHAALVVDGGTSLTYQEWDRRSDAVAHGLLAQGVVRGDRVALVFDNERWSEYALCCVAVQKTGGAAVPIPPRASDAEAAGVCDHAGVAVAVAADDRSVSLGASPVVRLADLERGQPQRAPAVPLEGDDLAEIIYTSGTTGRPKGVACSHASLTVHDLPSTPAADSVVFAHAFPIGTNAGQECMRMPLRRLATAVVLPAFDPERLCALVAERRVQRLQLVPAMAQMLVDSGATERHDVSSVEAVTLSSAPAPPALLSRLAEALPHAALWNAYALTEGGSARTLMRYDPDRPGSVGRPIGATEVAVVGDDGAEAPVGRVGEIWLRRPGAPTRAYYRDPAATAAAFEGDWLRTGDLGYLDDDGYLHLVDRKDDLIISGGINVSSVEVEHTLCAHPAVREAAAFGIDHPVMGQDVAAAVVAGGTVDARELHDFARRRLGEHKAPRHIRFVDRLPRNDTGKALKRQLREWFAEASAQGVATAARNETEAAVLGIWQAVLGRDDVGVDDDFFDLGGHSLAATQVVARVADAFDVELPVDAVFERPTVTDLAAAVDDAAARAP